MTKLFSLHALGTALAVVAGGVLATGASAETLRLGNEGVYPPFSMIDSDGNPSGFEPDLAREVCKRMDVDCEIIVMDFKALIPSILQGKFDMITTQLAPTPERLAKLTYGRPIVYNPMTFVAKKDTDYEYTKEGLEGKGIKLGLQRGAASIPYVDKHWGDVFERVYYDNPDQMKLDLLAGRIDMVFDSKINWTIELIDKPEGEPYKLTGGDHWIGDPDIPPAKRGYSWAVRKGDPEGEALIEKVNATIDATLADCTFTELRKKYLSAPILTAEEPCL
ncbi:transporter substrate-binding domain-containing protein [Acuticoccus mangrovi]|uniref:Transporter substrate-binding domain-containing protein n=1 Tax=Acuticoccus mangrovi TaxID=2796142 RepID=A0A934IKN6_9HYPH|nr:transporter substrate-binding domain-containing protein [Acuticoccus mangrovi]MBJ3774067.1 transporter substrate-binding domain-containing protein [Acuticoccus mangrovi]